jgi:hypothetical protein
MLSNECSIMKFQSNIRPGVTGVTPEQPSPIPYERCAAMKTKEWNCPNCEMSSKRHGNVKRHIQRRHRTMGEPVSYDTMQYYKDMTPQNFRFPLAYSHHTSLSFPTPKEKPHKNFSDLLEDQILQPLRKVVEYKNLLAQLEPTFPSSSGSPNVAYQEVSTVDFEDMYRIYNISNIFETPFPPDSWMIIGIKGRVCQNCLNQFYIPLFFKFQGKNEIFQPQHECYEFNLPYSSEETEEVLNTSNISLTKQMMQLIKTWLQGKDYLILAKEIGEYYPVIGDIDADQKDHWSARAIRNKLTTLKDDNELTDFLAKTNNSTFGMFKVYSSQQFSPRFYVFMIIKKEWL